MLENSASTPPAGAPAPVSPQAPPLQRRAVVAGTVGHALEWFDFGVYAYLAVIIAAQFFPSEDPTASLLSSLAVFGVGFVARPLGALYFGRLGDRRGRKAVLLTTLMLMAVATLGIAVTPTYATIGAVAPLVLVVCRLLQGFSAGGETTTAVAYLVEWAPPRRRGFFGSFMQIGSAVGLLTGSLVVALCTAVLGETSMSDWGWRVPFVIGGLLAPIAYLIRRSTEETPHFTAAQDEREAAPAAGAGAATAARRVAGPRSSSVVRAFLFSSFWSVTFYFFLTYMPTLLQREFDVSGSAALWVNVVSLVFYTCLIPITGALSDRLGRKPLALASAVAFIVVPIPLFHALTGTSSTLALYGTVLAVGLFLSLFTGPAPATLAEFFPTANRSSGMAIGYSLAAVVFGGFTPYVCTWLIDVTGQPLAPVYYVAAISLLAVPVLLSQRETARTEMR